MLRQTFIELAQKYTGELQLIQNLWNEIEDNYSDKKRHYHTLSHLHHLHNQLTEVRDQIEDWDAILCALFYHDVIYNASRNDNEEQSAALAGDRLRLLLFPAQRISKCISHILATKGHSQSNDHDTNLFTDADLSILGQNWNSYSKYCRQIRKEYSIYPDFIYKPGRKKVLHHFMNMESIFKTAHFFRKYESAARENIMRELKEL